MASMDIIETDEFVMINHQVSKKDQKKTIKTLEEELGGLATPKVSGELFYILNNEWWESWKDYVAYDKDDDDAEDDVEEKQIEEEDDDDDNNNRRGSMASFNVNVSPNKTPGPGKIDNRKLCDKEQVLKLQQIYAKFNKQSGNEMESSNPNEPLGDGIDSSPLSFECRRDVDYIYVHPSIWDKLLTWYGVNSSLDVLKRYATAGQGNGEIEVERNPIYFEAFCVDSKLGYITEEKEVQEEEEEEVKGEDSIAVDTNNNNNNNNNNKIANYSTPMMWMQSLSPDETLLTILQRNLEGFNKLLPEDSKLRNGLFRLHLASRPESAHEKGTWKPVLTENDEISFIFNKSIIDALHSWKSFNFNVDSDMDHEWGGEKTKADLYKTISLLTTPVLQLLHKDMKRILLVENFAWRQNIVKEKVVMNLEGYYDGHNHQFQQIFRNAHFTAEQTDNGEDQSNWNKLKVELINELHETPLPDDILDFILHLLCRNTLEFSEDEDGKIKRWGKFMTTIFSSHIDKFIIEDEEEEKKLDPFSLQKLKMFPSSTATGFDIATATTTTTSSSSSNVREIIKLDKSQNIDQQVTNFLNDPSNYIPNEDYYREPGEIGLDNLGQTCYMNSMLQCLSNTKLFTSYFLTNFYKHEINRTSRDGLKGELAVVYGNLIKQMWAGNKTYIAPRAFKRTIGSKYEQFAGYLQQDSQEFMINFMDTLHEDLNRVKEKPYVPAIESDGMQHDDLAQQTWENYLLRENSFVIDHCAGLQRSHLTCPLCKRESITFEKYNQLALPLPVGPKALRITVIRLPDVYIHNQQYYIERVARLSNLNLRKASRGYIAVEKVDSDKTIDKETKRLLKSHPWLQSSHVSTVQLPLKNFMYGDEIKKTVINLPEFQNPYYDFPSCVSEEIEDDMGMKMENKTGNTEEKEFIPLYMKHVELLKYNWDYMTNRDNTGYCYYTDYYLIETRHSNVWNFGYNNEGKSVLSPQHNGKIDYRHPLEAKTAEEREENRDLYPLHRNGSLPIHYTLPKGYYIGLFSQNFMFVVSDTYSTKVTAWEKPGVHMTLSGLWTCTDLYREVWTSIKPFFHHNKHNAIDTHLRLYEESGEVSESSSSEDQLPKDIDFPFTLVSCTMDNYSERFTFSKEIPVNSKKNALDYINTVRSTTAWLKDYVAICFRSLNEKETYINNGLYNIKSKTSTKSDSNVRIEETKHFSDEEKKKDQELRKNYPLGDFQSSEDSLLLLSDEKEIDTETNDLEEEQEGEEDDNGELTLAKCLRKFTKKERLDDQNMWYCNKCKEHVNADKKVDIWTTPDILIIHFKRFYAINQYTQGKIDDLVTFPIEGLDFSSIMKGPTFKEAPPIYDLYAVSQQSGSLRGGHYTAVCQNFRNKKWYSFNDSFVRVCDASDAIDERAYVLMYHRRTGSLRGGGLTSPKILGLPPTLNDEPPENHEDEDEGNNFDGKYDDDDDKDNFAADTNEYEEGYTMFN